MTTSSLDLGLQDGSIDVFFFAKEKICVNTV